MWTKINKIVDPKIMCMDCYMRELMLYVSSNIEELDTKMKEAQQSKFICSSNSDVFNVQWCYSDTV